MDQPPQQPTTISIEGILAWFLGVVATLGAIVVRGKFRVKAMREKVEADAKPKMDVEFIRESREITAEWKEEVTTLRAQVDKIRADYEGKLSVWMERALTAERQIPEMRAEILMLKKRVAELEKIAGGAVKRGES